MRASVALLTKPFAAPGSSHVQSFVAHADGHPDAAPSRTFDASLQASSPRFAAVTCATILPPTTIDEGRSTTSFAARPGACAVPCATNRASDGRASDDAKPD